MRSGPVIAISTALAGVIAWPALMFQGETSPDRSCLAVADAWARIAALGRWFHDIKNLGTELFRCDPQWWFKFSSFVGTVESLMIVALAIWAIILRRLYERSCK